MQINGFHVTKMEKKIMWLITTIAFVILISSLVLGATLSRTASSTVNPGSTFTVTYTPSGTSGKYFVAFDETITGCTPTSYKSFIGSEAGTPETKQVTFTAPSSGSCTFNGFYQFAESTKTNFPQLTVTVGTISTCEDYCLTLSHVECVGEWEISGTYPSCVCDWKCTEPSSWCEFAEKLAVFNMIENKCTEGTLVLVILGVIALVLITRLI